MIAGEEGRALVEDANAVMADQGIVSPPRWTGDVHAGVVVGTSAQRGVLWRGRVTRNVVPWLSLDSTVTSPP